MLGARRSHTPGYWAKNPDFEQTETELIYAAE
jgi:hypothetical protein